jgi:uncharacterized protein (DUF427 family)
VWKYRGKTPGKLTYMSNQTAPSRKESVWDYPRPPRVERDQRSVRVIVNDVTVAASHSSFRVLETSHPPVYYIPPDDVRKDCVQPSPRRTLCEFKGIAHYWNVRVGPREIRDAAWTYPSPNIGFEIIRDCFAFYPGLMDACYVGNERVQPQPGDFYGGWVTSDIVGPFKGGPGTKGW